jgi:hypothetical protein
VNQVTFIANFLWGLWAWACFALACAFSLLVVLIVPGAHRRQKLVTFIGKMIFVLAGVKVTMRGIDNLPTDSCVVVANHASYIDGILLNAYLPSRFGFVIKGEMRDIPIVHFLLRRSGSKFVRVPFCSKPALDGFVQARLLQRSRAICRWYLLPYRVPGRCCPLNSTFHAART